MNEDHQIYLPETFAALYMPSGKVKPSIGLGELLERYELCEDLANLLTEKAANMQLSLAITEDLVLQHCEQGLLTEPSVVLPCEARWVVRRLAELLNWPMNPAEQKTPPKGPDA
jgi:hypothetical protein